MTQKDEKANEGQWRFRYHKEKKKKKKCDVRQY